MKKRMLVTGIVTVAVAVAGQVWALGPRVPDPIPEVIQQGNVSVGLETVADGFVDPVAAAVAPGDKETLYVAEQSGKIWAVDLDQRGHGQQQAKRLIADLGSMLVPIGCFGINYDERGLLGLAFHPDFQHNGLVYTYTSENQRGPSCGAASPDHDNVVREWKIVNAGDDNGDDESDDGAAMIDTASSREVLREVHAQFNHNGGEIRFGPDGMLYVGIGDGGNADDQGPNHNPDIGNAQDLSTLSGKILRIDPNAGASEPGHSIPADNPFVGTPGARGEIWAYGFRNPFRMSFDRKTGDLRVGDVGQNDVEEIDVVVKAGNYGWRVKEGTFAFDPNGAGPGFVTADAITGPYIDPIAEHDHCVPPVTAGVCAGSEGVAIIGGFEYRGKKVKALRGMYVFGDYSRGFFASDGRIFVLDRNNKVSEVRYPNGPTLGMSVLGFAEDGRGELYVMGKTGATPGNTGITDPTNTSGVLLRIVKG